MAFVRTLAGTLAVAALLVALSTPSITHSQQALPQAVADAVRADAADRDGEAGDGASAAILRAEAVTWNSACLGAAAPGEFCAEVLTPGYVAWVRIGDEALRYHTNEAGSELRLVERGLNPDAVAGAPLPSGAMPRDARNGQVEPPPQTYSVQSGDTLFRIAQRFGTTVDAIAGANALQDVNRIAAGQVLRIPTTSADVDPGGDPGTGGPETYTVQSGDTLRAIAQRRGVSIEAIVQANDIVNADVIHVGQVLVIDRGEPGSGTPPSASLYTVRAGDTLFAIASRFGTTVSAIAAANGIADVDRIAVGRALTIPGAPDAPGSSDPPALAQSCVADAFSVSYPAGWHTNALITEGGDAVRHELPACRYFDPEDFAVPPATEFIRAVDLRIEDRSFNDLAAALGQGPQRILSYEQATVDGRSALRVEIERTDTIILPAGTRTTAYYVDLGDAGTFVANTHGVGDYDYAANVDVLERMVASVEFTGQ